MNVAKSCSASWSQLRRRKGVDALRPRPAVERGRIVIRTQESDFLRERHDAQDFERLNQAEQ